MHDPYVLKRFLDEHKLELCSSVVPATIVPINMSYEKKRFCFYCKLDTDRLEKLNKSLKKCGSCKLAEYCGKECQRLDFHEGNENDGYLGHKIICEMYKGNVDLAAAAEKAMKAKGVVLNGRKTQNEFYQENPAVFESVKASGFGCRELFSQILGEKNVDFGQLLKNVDLGQLFMNYRESSLTSVNMLRSMAQKHKSYLGLEMALDAYLDLIMKLQPFEMYLRALVPLMLIQLGRDDEAYNFIKFWLKNTPKSCDFQISEDGLFLEKDLPFTEYTMKDQDKNEDIFEVLGIGLEKPYFIYVTFFLSLAIIKKNNFDATKDPKQMEHFKKTLKYIKCHFKNLVKTALDINVKEGRNEGRYATEDGTCPYVPERIPASYGLQKGKYTTTGQVEKFAAHFFDNFCDDLDSYLDMKKGLRKEMLKYL